MKSKEEIEQIDEVAAYKDGYSKCQEDMNDNAIRFAEWINKNDYEKIHGDMWCKKFMSYTHSTGELYQIYIESLEIQREIKINKILNDTKRSNQ